MVPGAELDPIAIEPERELDAEERARREAEEEERLRRERELIGDVDEDAPVAAKPAKLEGDASYSATGKRKSSIARVILRPGSGTIEVNKRTLEEYFPRSYLQSVAKQPLAQTGYEGNVDVRIRVHGGGVSGTGRGRQARHRPGPGGRRPGAAPRAQAPGDAHPRRPGQGAPQGRPQEGPQAPAVLQALASAPRWRRENSSGPTASVGPSGSCSRRIWRFGSAGRRRSRPTPIGRRS